MTTVFGASQTSESSSKSDLENGDHDGSVDSEEEEETEQQPPPSPANNNQNNVSEQKDSDSSEDEKYEPQPSVIASEMLVRLRESSARRLPDSGEMLRLHWDSQAQ
ncbi:serine threonine-protein phosphatase 6 regulatory subunit 2 [Limosa lapponica baueri]|uniref:Serine threonine-protein phosphatase 6 regulatory subunit 2 n=1 Tax=Limosa lapponica baueri TaxID=1758121 RepID=A0A2I0T4N7_LIMLA|nr:serine threonine-protein phosphatase 6 regulatory subunit 2 [Limosa lapponica baueri]